MKWVLFATALVAIAVCAESTDLAHKQQAINRLLHKITEPIRTRFTDLKEAAASFVPTGAGETLQKELEDGRLLKQKHWFSLFNPRHREEALLLVSALLESPDFDHFKKTAAYFREQVNEGEFVYALYVGVTHSEHTQDVVLPPLYEVTPHLFTNTEVIQRAYTAKMTQTPTKIRMEFTGSKKNPEQRVAYFGEDIGINSHHVHWHMDFPFWWNGHKIDRKGELFFWAHHQLTARFDAERLSNYLPFVDELYWDRPIKEGFAPHTTYRYGGEFPARPDNKAFEDVEGIVRTRDVKQTEKRIRDAIAHGYITSKDGTPIYINNERGIDILGDVIESSLYSPNIGYYGALHNYAHILLGKQADPKGKFNTPPGVMEHFETATRDPSFFRLHKYIDNIFKEHKDTLTPYSKDDIEYTNAKIRSVKIEGELTTYFEDYEFDLTNALDDTEEIDDVAISTTVHRLNHKPFSYKINVLAKIEETATVRIHLCPKYDYNHIELHLDEYRWSCIELDKFWTNLAAGENEILRKASESSVTIPDRVSFNQLIAEADTAVENESPLESHDPRACGHPARLLLPKGNTQGLEFNLFVAVTSGEDGTHDNAASSEHGSTHGYCGSKGEVYPDSKPMGYPLDRRIPDERVFDVKNINISSVKIYHK